MLQSLHVKNLALMEETEVEFGPGLNILTGETGAGKSLLLGSVSLALGAKFDPSMLRADADSCLVELIFTDTGAAVSAKLEELDLSAEDDGTVIISRKMAPGKSVCKINGETVTAHIVRELAELLLDIHGQHEHQSLLHRAKHLEILDEFCGDELTSPKEQMKAAYLGWKEIKTQLEEALGANRTADSDAALAEFEVKEIVDAALIPGEDEELERAYRKNANAQRILEGLYSVQRLCDTEEEGAGARIGNALRILNGLVNYDEELSELSDVLADTEAILSDFVRNISSHIDLVSLDPEEFARIENRLNLINHLKAKYGRTIEEILAACEMREQLLERIANYDGYIESLKAKEQEAFENLRSAAEHVREVRKKYIPILEENLTQSLLALNFLSVDFRIQCTETDYSENGADAVEFLISTNPGEAVRPLKSVASGGELSRVMLAIRTILAKKDDIGTLIFDEIDAGISGKTAWRVSEELGVVSKYSQVMCITHLPQIAAMADRHFVIEKSADSGSTITDIRFLEGDACLGELSRLLGGDGVSKAAIENAREMKSLADSYKTKTR